MNDDKIDTNVLNKATGRQGTIRDPIGCQAGQEPENVRAVMYGVQSNDILSHAAPPPAQVPEGMERLLEAAESRLREVEAAADAMEHAMDYGDENDCIAAGNHWRTLRALAPDRTAAAPLCETCGGRGIVTIHAPTACGVICPDCKGKPASAAALLPGLEPVAEIDWRQRAWIIHSTVTGERCGSPDDIRYLALALGGEVGELQNLIKKDWRQEWGHKVDDQHRLEDEIDDEIADSAVYLYLLCKARGRDLDYITEKKMLIVQQRYGEEVQAAIRAAQRTALLALAQRMRQTGRQGDANEIEEILK